MASTSTWEFMVGITFLAQCACLRWVQGVHLSAYEHVQHFQKNNVTHVTKDIQSHQLQLHAKNDWCTKLAWRTIKNPALFSFLPCLIHLRSSVSSKQRWLRFTCSNILQKYIFYSNCYFSEFASLSAMHVNCRKHCHNPDDVSQN